MLTAGKRWSQCCHEKLRLKLFEKYEQKELTKTQINVLKNFYGIFQQFASSIILYPTALQARIFPTQTQLYYSLLGNTFQ